MNKIEEKREQEKETVTEMIRFYCKKTHKSDNEELCSECKNLLNYAILRVNNCPFMETKTFCSNCKVHCYKPEMREKIRIVMRYSGPRMLFVHPVMCLKHLIESKKEKRRLKLSA